MKTCKRCGVCVDLCLFLCMYVGIGASGTMMMLVVRCCSTTNTGRYYSHTLFSFALIHDLRVNLLYLSHSVVLEEIIFQFNTTLLSHIGFIADFIAGHSLATESSK